MIRIQKKQSGKEFHAVCASSPEDYLSTVLQAEKYLATNRVETEEGVYWKTSGTGGDNRTELMSRMGLYGGSAGILYFYLKLYQATGEEPFLDMVRKAVAYICVHLPQALPQEIKTIEKYQAGVSLDIGILGVSGIGFVLAEVYECFFWENVGKTLKVIRDFYLEHCEHCREGIFWTGSTTMITDTAVLLFLLKYESLFREKKLNEAIRSAGEWFLSRQIPMEDGRVRYAGLECVWEGVKPNFEVGTAGSGFMLARLYEFTGDRRFLETAEKCAAFLHQCRIPQAKGYLIPFRMEQTPDSAEVICPEKEPLCYLGTCSGPAGTCRFFYLLYRLTGKAAYLKEIYDLVDGMEACGAPERQSAGLWNNVNFCCGHAGILQFFLALYQDRGEKHLRELAIRTANVILGEKEELPDGAVRWRIAQERIRPDVFSTPLGYYMGTAGIASALLQLYLSETGKFHWKRLPDDPFPEEGECKQCRTTEESENRLIGRK